MGNDDKLCLLAQVAQIGGIPLHVPVIQCRVDLVEHTERRGPHLQNSEIQSNGNKCLLTAGQQRDCLKLLSGRLYPDLNAAAQGILGILQHKLSLAAAKHLLEGLPEVFVDFLKLRHKDGGHLLGDLTNDGLQFLLGCQNIIPLTSQVCIALIDTDIFLDGT